MAEGCQYLRGKLPKCRLTACSKCMHRQAGHDYINVTEKSFSHLEDEKKTRENHSLILIAVGTSA